MLLNVKWDRFTQSLVGIVGVTQSLSGIGVTQSLSGIGVTQSLSGIGVTQSLSRIGVTQSLSRIGVTQSLSFLCSVLWTIDCLYDILFGPLPVFLHSYTLSLWYL